MSRNLRGNGVSLAYGCDAVLVSSHVTVVPPLFHENTNVPSRRLSSARKVWNQMLSASNEPLVDAPRNGAVALAAMCDEMRPPNPGARTFSMAKITSLFRSFTVPPMKSNNDL